MNEWGREHGAQTQWNYYYYSVITKELNLTICCNWDETGKYCIKWDKPDTNSKVQHVLTYV